MNEKYVINIGRQLGSGGKYVAKKLAEDFGIRYFDKELLDLAAKESGFGKEFFEKADEMASNAGRSFFGFNLPFIGGGDLYDSYLSNDTLFKIQSDVIRNLSEKESCIFVGRCADYILREHPHKVNIFISADEEDRINRLQKLHPELNREQILNLMEKGDKKRASFYNYYSCNTWGAAATYHLCINSTVLGIDKTVEFCKEFIQKKLQF